MVVYTNQEYWYNDGLSFSCTKNTQLVYLSTSMTPTAFDIAYLPFSNSGNVQIDVGIGHNIYFVDTTGQDNSITIQPQFGEYINGTYSYTLVNPAYTSTLCTNLGSGVWSILNTANIASSGGAGSQGPQGDIGFQGPQGDIGFQGTQGIGTFSFTFSAFGNQGPTGPQGDIGVQGYQGLTGPQGFIGLTGSQGPQGFSGATGSQGPQGFIGLTGSQGPQGLSGATGSIGPMGASQGSVSVLFNGNGANITTGSKGYVLVPYDATILNWSLISTATGSIVIDVKKSSYASFPNTTSIAGSELPTLTNQIKNQDLSLGTWTTAITNNDVLEFVVNSNTGITWANLNIKITKTV